MDADPTHGGFREKAAQELRDYLAISIYLAIFLSSLTAYRRLLMAEYGLPQLSYGIAVVEALVLGKIVLIGRALHFGERLDDSPLIFTMLYKSAAFGFLTIVFGILEHIIRGWFNGKTAAEALTDLVVNKRYEVMGRLLLMFVAFIPLFAFLELERVLGEGTLNALFFRRRAQHRDQP